MARRITEAQRRHVIELWLDLKIYREIHDITGISLGKISNTINEERKRIPDLDELRDLKKALQKSNTNFLDAKRGAKLLENTGELNLSITKIPDCIELLNRHGKNADNVLEWGLRLMKLETIENKPYKQIMVDGENIAKKTREWESYTDALKLQEKTLRQSIREYELLKTLQDKLDQYNLTPTRLEGFITRQIELNRLGFTTEKAQILASELAKKGMDAGGAADRLSNILSQYGALEDAISKLLDEQRNIKKEIVSTREDLTNLVKKLSSSKNELKNIEDYIDKRKIEYQNKLNQLKEKDRELEAARRGLTDVETALIGLQNKLYTTEPLMALNSLMVYPTAHLEPSIMLKAVRGVIEGFKIQIEEHPEIIKELHMPSYARQDRTLLGEKPPQKPLTLKLQILLQYLVEINYTLMEGLKHVARKAR